MSEHEKQENAETAEEAATPAPDQLAEETAPLAASAETPEDAAPVTPPAEPVASPEEAAASAESETQKAAAAGRQVRVVGIRFHLAGPIHWHALGDTLTVKHGDGVIVEVERGMEQGRAVTDVLLRPFRKGEHFPRVVRLMDERDRGIESENAALAKAARTRCRDLIASLSLPMRLVKVEYQHSGNKAVFYFSSEGRVDFRELVRLLAQEMHIRVEMRQIGIRDEAKLLGGLGPCGLPTCCNSYLTEFAPVSIRMAKEQNLTLNPEKVSGLCGRLMCCLGYESEHYNEKQKDLPKIGKKTTTWRGRGRVLEINIFTEQMRLEMDETHEICSVNIDDFKAYRLDPEGYAAKMAEKEERERKEKSQNFSSRRGRAPMDRTARPERRFEPTANENPPTEGPQGSTANGETPNPGEGAAPAPRPERRDGPGPDGQGRRSERGPQRTSQNGPRPPREGRPDDRPPRPPREPREPRPDDRPPRESRPDDRPPRPPREPRPDDRPPRPPREPRPDDRPPQQGTLVQNDNENGEGAAPFEAGGENGERSRNSRHRRRRRHPSGANRGPEGGGAASGGGAPSGGEG